jgi:hypothetical protein
MEWLNMNWTKYPAVMLMLIFLAACALAQEDPLNPAPSAAATQEITGDDILSPVPQDQKGNATPVITKALPGSIADQQSSQSKARLLSPISSWSLSLLDNLERAALLQMSQSSDVVFGKGTLTIGSSVQDATATGTVSGNKLSLDILTDDLTLFRLSLTMNGKSLSGDYHGYSTIYVPWKGIAMGKINQI